MKKGFTMIELIFVIVILGILAAVAIPKLAATRNDATASTLATSLATCINDAGGSYMMTGLFTGTAGSTDEGTNSAACADATTAPAGTLIACYAVAGVDATGIISVTTTVNGDQANTAVCEKAVALSNVNGISVDTGTATQSF